MYRSSASCSTSRAFYDDPDGIMRERPVIDRKARLTAVLSNVDALASAWLPPAEDARRLRLPLHQQ
jgi:hypothetical protein